MKGVVNALVYSILGFLRMEYIAALLGILIGIAYKAFHWIV